MPSSETAVTSVATWRIVPGVKSPDPPPTASTGMPSFLRRQRADLVRLGQRGPVEAGRSGEAARARVGAGELVDVGVGERIRESR